MAATSKKTVSVKMSDELYSKLDKKCNELGIGKSAYIAMKLSETLSTEDKLYDQILMAVKQVLKGDMKDEL